jgi:polyvinyl alcohol dehydrogenase (cytochrome)
VVGDRTVPTISTLATLPPERIYQAITTGTMAVHAASLPDRQKRDLTEFVAKRPFLDIEGTGLARMTNRCTSNPALPALSANASWNGWGGSRNARFQPQPAAGLDARAVPRLTLKWAFGFPGGGVSSSQPTVALGRVFVASDNRVVYSIDARSGCAYWAFHADSIGRFAPSVGPISGYPGTRYAVFFVTGPGNAFAVDAQDGKLLWRTEIRGGPQNVSASSTLHEGRLYVPFAGTETMSGASATYECCRSRGGVAALDANTGRILWKVDSIPEPVRSLGKNANGTSLWGPSGASVWNAPTVDAKRRRIYVGTGNSYGPVAADTSDSILALNMDDGKIVWSHQEFKGDSFMVGCGPKNPPGGNCPETLGPDWDFGGASVILETLPNGRDILVAAGKGGVAIALDPDAGGKMLWRTTLYEQPPSALGLVLFGGTSDGVRAYYPLQQPGGGLTAVRLDTGAIEWKARIDADRRGQGGAASSIPGVVFTGGWDGILRAVDGAGKVIWSFDTNTAFQTINGAQARGGSLGPPGAAIVNGMVYVVSGYVGVQQGTAGNVLLAFGVN